MKRYKVVLEDGTEEEIECKEYTVDSYCNIRFLDDNDEVILFANCLKSIKYIAKLS